jgi:hypothetical protein
MEAVRTSETSVYFNETTRRYFPEGCHLHIYSVLDNTNVYVSVPRTVSEVLARILHGHDQ